MLTEKNKSDGLYKTIIHYLFSPMNLGCLEINLPNGELMKYGTSQSDVKTVININNFNFFRRCVLFGDIGFAESYISGEWDTPDLKKVIDWMLINIENHPTLMDRKEKTPPINLLGFLNKLYLFFNQNTIKGSKKNIESHYDLGNSFFKLFLDQTMTYSSAYFKPGMEDLEEAQILKYELLCKKINLSSNDHILEIGSGWGGFSLYAAQTYGCNVTSITISEEQFKYVNQQITKNNLNQKIKVLLSDYRNVSGSFDKIVSIEMIEAVGDKFLSTYLKKCQSLLKKDGILAIQAILSPDHRYDSFKKNVDFIQKHIFPGSLLPSLNTITKTMSKTGDCCLIDYEDLTQSYSMTLSLWRENFIKNIDAVKKLGFDESFIRKWIYYFCYCESAFDLRNISVAHLIFSRPNNPRLNYPLRFIQSEILN